jgi:hypothetical protein
MPLAVKAPCTPRVPAREDDLVIELPPVPGRIAGLPRDPRGRGYPIPAETLWLRGKPPAGHAGLPAMRRTVRTRVLRGLRVPLTPEDLYRLFSHDDATAGWRWHDEPFDAVNQ